MEAIVSVVLNIAAWLLLAWRLV